MTATTETRRPIAFQSRSTFETCKEDLRDVVTEMADMVAIQSGERGWVPPEDGITPEMLFRWITKVGGAAMLLRNVLDLDAEDANDPLHHQRANGSA